VNRGTNIRSFRVAGFLGTRRKIISISLVTSLNCRITQHFRKGTGFAQKTGSRAR
jgi:hypothetical protein